jgi:hypothetical protein
MTSSKKIHLVDVQIGLKQIFDALYSAAEFPQTKRQYLLLHRHKASP